MDGDEIPLYAQTEGEYEEEEELDEEELEAQNTIPLFKYQSLPFCQKEEKETLRVTCFKAHERLVALGTQDGQVRVLDILGNLIKKFHPHRSTINDIYIDPEAELIATCSDDGFVFFFFFFFFFFLSLTLLLFCLWALKRQGFDPVSV